MFALVIHEESRPPWRKAFAKREITIGSTRDNDLVLADPERVSQRHARIVVKDGKYILVDLKSSTGTFVNGRKMASPLVVRESDTIVVGVMRLEIVTLEYEELAGARYTARDPNEDELLAAIAAGDDASRLVYADWLEGNGEHARAEVLRIQAQLADEGAHEVDDHVDAKTARVRELVASIELPWRARMLRLPIENCPQFAFACPKQWSQLQATTEDGTRFCTTCSRNVYYCATIDEGRKHAAQGNCVALDLASPRWQGDLDAPFGERVCDACELDVGEGLRDCPRCGQRITTEYLMLGRMA